MLKVRLIGKFDIQCDGQPIILSSRAAQSLFAYLILTAGTLHRREKLAGMFWPDESEQKARTYLRNELWRIRKAFPKTSNVEYLLADNLTIGFNSFSAYQLDVAELKKLSDMSSADELIQALSNYQGELLPGFYEDWAVLEREHLQVFFEQKIARLLEILEKEQRWNDILEWAERWISFGQAPEAAYGALMVAYDALGEHVKVTSTYERCKQALRELDLEPSEQTRALAFKRNPKFNIPIPLTSFIGREKELKEITDLFSKSRLITLTGSGGVGKTRLAIQVVADVLDRFPDGVWFLDLAPLGDPALVPNTLASLLGFRESGDIKLSVTDQLINYFRSRAALVIFDNCEHLIESSAQLVNSLLISCEKLSILATSHEALRVSGEIPYRVPSLSLPPDFRSLDDFGSLTQFEAIQLFMERASAISSDFKLTSQNAPFVVQICQRLDGIPLAIELGAARVNMLTVEQIMKRLDDRFNLLTGGLRSALPRHQTLRALIEWSYDLLSAKERILFRRLAVFAGGWTLAAAEEVCCRNGIEASDILDLLSHLVNKSLVLVDTKDSVSRYRRLETIHQFAREKLFETAEAAQLRRNHAMYYSNQVSITEDELDNIRLVFSWCLENGEAEPALRLGGDFFFWEKRVSEGLHLITQVLALPDAQGQTQERGRALYSSAVLSGFHRNYSAARAFGEELGRLGHAIKNDGVVLQQKFINGVVAIGEGDYESAYEIFLNARRQADSSLRYALCTHGMAACELGLHHLDGAKQYAEEARKILDELSQKNFLIDVDTILGYVALEEDNLAMAWHYFRRGIQTAVSNSAQQRLGIIYAGLGGIALRERKFYEAARWFGISEMTIMTTGYYGRAFPEATSQHYRAQVKSLLDPDVFQTAWQEGCAMTLEQAVDHALKI
jgi:predicted ATPase/DNA-binding SARP family transcriptional activator